MKQLNKILIFSLFTLSFVSAKSPVAHNRGMVIVLEAPLFRTPDAKSKVLKYVRKGDIIYIHPKYFRNGPVDKNFDNLEDYFEDENPVNLYYESSSEKSKKPADEEETLFLENNEVDKTEHYYLTLDDLGTRAYIPKRFVKLIYQDEREFLTQVNPFKKDPTDYRLPEPLSKNYPFMQKELYRYWFGFGGGTQAKKKYPYKSNTEKETFGSQLEFKSSVAWKVNEQIEERLFFGGIFHMQYFENNFEIFFPIFDRKSKERRLTFGAGPYISYDTIRFEPFQITLYQGFLLNFNQHNVFQSLTSNDGEERAFKGFSFTSSSGILLTRKNLLGDHIDIFLGTSLQIDLPYNLKSKRGNSTFASLWREDGRDQITYSTQANLSLFAGIQFIP